MLARAQSVDGLLEVLGRRVELVVDLGLDAVLLAADHADLDLEDDLGLGRRLFSSSLAMSRFSSIGTAEPSHMCDWNSGLPPVGDPLLRDRQQRPDVGVELVLGAVVGVQRHGDRVLLGDDVRELGERDRTGHHLLDAETGGELGPAGRELDDAVAARIREALDGGVDGFRAHAVDGGKREGMLLGPAEHLGVDLGCCDGHERSSRRSGRSASISGTARPHIVKTPRYRARPCCMAP